MGLHFRFPFVHLGCRVVGVQGILRSNQDPKVSARAQVEVPPIKFHSLRCSISQPGVSLPLHAGDRVRRAAPSRSCLSATKQRRAGA